MAQIRTDEKGFKLINTTAEEIKAIGSMGICDHCNEMPERGVFVAVLSHWICPSCYLEWERNAVRYAEDEQYELRSFNTYRKALGV